MGKLWTESINKHIDWGGDSNTENLPVSGEKVQEFIKDSLNKKSGVFYKDLTSNKYLIFSDEEDKNTYLSNTTQTGLIIGEIVIPSSLSELTDDVVKDKYLSLKGGVIDSSETTPMSINSSSESTSINLQNKNTNKTIIGWNSSDGSFLENVLSGKKLSIFDDGTFYFGNNEVLNSENYSKYAISLTGGVLKGVSPYNQYVLTLNTDDETLVGLRLKSQDVDKGAFEWSSDTNTNINGIRIRNITTGDCLGLSDAGNPMYNNNTVLHSGNYSTYALPLSGGTLESTNSDILQINRLNSTSPTSILFRSTGKLLGRLGFSATSFQPVVQVSGQYSGVYQTILHAGNYNTFALPLSGGTIGDGKKDVPLSINGIGSNVAIALQANGVVKGYVNWNQTWGTHLVDGVNTNYRLGIKPDGTPYYSNSASSSYTILTSAGGTIEGVMGALSIKRNSEYSSAIKFENTSGILGYIGFGSSGAPYIWDANQGNAKEILTSAGGTISGALIIEASSPAVTFKKSSDSNPFASLGIYGNKLAMYVNSEAKYYDILHSGNVGEYKAGDSVKLGGLGSSYYMVGLYSTSQDVNVLPYESNRPYILRVGANNPNLPNDTMYGNLVHFAVAGADTAFQLMSSYGSDLLLYRRGDISSIFSADWKTIAFTDSDITGYAAGLKHSNGTVGATVASSGKVDFSTNISLALNKSILDPSGRSAFAIDGNNSPQIGLDTCGYYSTYINGKDVYLRYGSSRTAGLILNSSGNVTIGNGDLASSNWKLLVDGNAIFNCINSANPSLGSKPSKSVHIGDSNYGLQLWTNNTGLSNIQAGRIDGTARAYNIALNPLGGNVLIGTSTNNGAKLQVNGGIYADTYINFNPNESYGIFRGNLISARLSSEDIAVVSPKFYIGATCLIGDTKVVDSEAIMLVYGKSYIEGNLHVTGNIIADGEVSAGENTTALLQKITELEQRLTALGG